jgi:hypothetical protein
VAKHSAVNSDLKVEVSTVFWAFENQIIGEQFKKMSMPI